MPKRMWTEWIKWQEETGFDYAWIQLLNHCYKAKWLDILEVQKINAYIQSIEITTSDLAHLEWNKDFHGDSKSI